MSTQLKDEQELETDTLSETLRAGAVGEDAPVEEKHPEVAGALVGYTYPLALIALLLAALAAMAFWY